MAQPCLSISTVLSSHPIVQVPYNSDTRAEEVCEFVCRELSIGPIARHLFALRFPGELFFLMPNATFGRKHTTFELRVRFKPASYNQVRTVDARAYEYFFHQVRRDVFENKAEFKYEEPNKELFSKLFGLGVIDMYRVMIEKKIPMEIVESEYKKYIPREVIRVHQLFVKKPMHKSLLNLQGTIRNLKFLQIKYFEQFEEIAPEYLTEWYKAVRDDNGVVTMVTIKVSPFHPNEPGVLFVLGDKTKEKSWQRICSLEEIGFVSVRDDGTVEISRKNGIPCYLKFSSMKIMFSFISCLDGYYRLTYKWIFNICQAVETPSLKKLSAMRCHGPVGGEFSYAKLEEKRSNRPGCFIIRESESKYDSYFVDVCVRDSVKPKTFTLERLNDNEYIFNNDLTTYQNIHQLMKAYNNPDGEIYLQECIPPSDLDESQLLLCQKDLLPGDSVTDTSTLNSLLPKSPMCINCKDLQVYKDRNCLKWNKNRKKVKEVNGTISAYDKFDKTAFPDGSPAKAKKTCRNPDGDVGGPWCFVEDEDTDDIEREYCDIPFCDEQECEVFAKNPSVYSHYTDFNETLANLTFGLKVWDSDSFQNASARLVLSLMALPLTGKELEDLGVGIEIFISNHQSALTFGNKDSKPDYEDTRGVLKSTSYTMFSLSWRAPFVSLFLEGQVKPIFLAEYRTKNNVMGFRKHKFRFYSALGTNVLWSFPFCKDDFECDVHTTTGSSFQNFWPLRKSEVGHELHFHLRAFHSVRLLFVPSPSVHYPRIEFAIQVSKQTSTVIAFFARDSSVVIKEMSLPNLLDYWEWREFSIGFFADSMQFYWSKVVGNSMIFELKHRVFKQVRWFSPSSETIAHWSFFCTPPEYTKPPPALLPECALNAEEQEYKGSQDVTEGGLPCLPWSGKNLIPDDIKGKFEGKDGSLAAWNYCRDPAKEEKGTFCYAITSQSDRKVEKKYCRLRKCKSEQCRMAGTGNDYVGALNTTRSNRSCQSWLGGDVIVHAVNADFQKVELFADATVEDARNFCRNPSRSVSGSWCYTTDPKVPLDACNVRDCDRPEENIVIIRGEDNWKVYVDPKWKISGLEFALKEWNPDMADGVIFSVTPAHGQTGNVRLVIGAEGNQKVLLYNGPHLAKQKTFPHLISTGKWADFWLLIQKGKLALGFKGVPNALFEWSDDERGFDPMFLSYFSIGGAPIGVFFTDEECQTENVTAGGGFSKVMPVGLWAGSERPVHSNLTLKVRGVGVALVRLYLMPETWGFYTLRIDRDEVILLSESEEVVAGYKADHLIDATSWTKLRVEFVERTFAVWKENNVVLQYERRNGSFMFYWFGVAVTEGWFAYNVNCEYRQPLDIDGPPRDGGWSAWSPWQCSVTCGGGEGFRTRTCSNPSPNIFGKLCPGEPRSVGVCNDFECGDISTTTLHDIRRNLQTHQFSFVIKEGRSIVLENDLKMLQVVKKESPDAYFEWTLNGIFVSPEEGRVILRGDDNLVIREAESSDSGVYVCMLYRVNRKRVVLRVVTLAVITEDYAVQTRATRSYVLTCNSVVLAYIYTGLSMKLVHNKAVYRDHGITTLAAVNAERFDSFNVSDSGDWQCVVEQKDLKLSWVTNYVRIDVGEAPNFYTNLMEDKATKPLFGRLKTKRNVQVALGFIVGFVLAMVALLLFVYFKFCTVRSRWQ